MANLKGYPSWFSANLVHTILFILFVTGCFLGPTTLTTRLEWQIPWQLPDDSRILVMVAHVLFAFIGVALIGALWAIHMRYWWIKRKGRWSGVALMSILAFLGFTGIGILYIGHQELQTLASTSHLFVGLGLAVPYVWHSVIRVKTRDRKRKSK